jgi:hypothetical protein
VHGAVFQLYIDALMVHEYSITAAIAYLQPLEAAE